MSRSRIAALVFLVVMAWGVFEVSRQFRVRSENPAVKRLYSKDLLRDYEKAFAAFLEAEDRWPKDMIELWTWPRFTAVSGRRVNTEHPKLNRAVAKGAGFYRYRRPEPDAPPDTVVFASEQPHRSVAAGEPFGKKGEVAETDVPATYFVLNKELQIEKLTEDEFARRVPWMAEHR